MRETKTIPEQKAKIKAIIDRLSAIDRKNLAVQVAHMFEPEPPQPPGIPAKTEEKAGPQGFGDGGVPRALPKSPRGFRSGSRGQLVGGRVRARAGDLPHAAREATILPPLEAL
jgi:hypothetical protein